MGGVVESGAVVYSSRIERLKGALIYVRGAGLICDGSTFILVKIKGSYTNEGL